MARARGKQRRYENAVRRQIALRADRPREYAPVEEFLRPGDTADMFRDDTDGAAQ